MSILRLLSIVCMTRVSCRCMFLVFFTRGKHNTRYIGKSRDKETKIVSIDNMFFIVLLINDFLVLELYPFCVFF